jgi:hypothetical protein
LKRGSSPTRRERRLVGVVVVGVLGAQVRAERAKQHDLPLHERPPLTRIAERKTKMHGETSAEYRGRTLLVEINPHHVVMREKGRRRSVGIPWLFVYELGLKLEARQAYDKSAQRDTGKIARSARATA